MPRAKFVDAGVRRRRQVIGHKHAGAKQTRRLVGEVMEKTDGILFRDMSDRSNG